MRGRKPGGGVRNGVQLVLCFLVASPLVAGEVGQQAGDLPEVELSFELLGELPGVSDPSMPATYSGIVRLGLTDEYALLSLQSRVLVVCSVSAGCDRKLGRGGRGPGEFITPAWVRYQLPHDLLVYDNGQRAILALDALSGEEWARVPAPSGIMDFVWTQGYIVASALDQTRSPASVRAAILDWPSGKVVGWAAAGTLPFNGFLELPERPGRYVGVGTRETGGNFYVAMLPDDTLLMARTDRYWVGFGGELAHEEATGEMGVRWRHVVQRNEPERFLTDADVPENLRSMGLSEQLKRIPLVHIKGVHVLNGTTVIVQRGTSGDGEEIVDLYDLRGLPLGWARISFQLFGVFGRHWISKATGEDGDTFRVYEVVKEPTPGGS